MQLSDFFIQENEFFEIAETILLESSGWTIMKTKAYKKGEKKYRNDSRIMNNLSALVSFITTKDRQPIISDYPDDLRVHAISSDKRFGDGVLWSHLKGQKIGLLFNPDYSTKKLTMIHLGTHQDLGWR